MKTRRRPPAIVVSFVLIVLSTSWAAWRFQEQQTEACHQRRGDRIVLRALVVQAYSGTVNPLDLTKVSGFDELDPATRQYLSNLSAAINTGGADRSDAARQQALNTIPPITC